MDPLDGMAETIPQPISRIAPAAVRYIKLGPGGRWFAHCREANRLEFGYPDVARELMAEGDWEAVRGYFLNSRGVNPGKARDFTREIREFHTAGADCLWITFAEGCLWWAFAAPEVHWLGGDGEAHGVMYRSTLSPWRNTDRTGRLLSQAALSTRLTQVAGYRQTICRVAAEAYVVRRINAVEDPTVGRALALQQELITVAGALIAELHWADFELLVDLIFARSGWRRLSAVGGTQKDIDLALEQPSTGERAFVQVKSRATAAILNDYIARFQADPTYQRMFFVCHSPQGNLPSPADAAIHVWVGPRLAEMTLQAGLFDWLIERVA
ncbi:MAG: restriction endonuclease [Gammaproteobacteria bacterium]|nr:restriction endonuclease [Gammaproteobacteria bacterium]